MSVSVTAWATALVKSTTGGLSVHVDPAGAPEHERLT